MIVLDTVHMTTYAQRRTKTKKKATEKLTGSIAEAVTASGVSRSKLYQYIRTGRLRTCTLDRKRLVVWQSLRALLFGEDRSGALTPPTPLPNAPRRNRSRPQPIDNPGREEAACQ